MTGHIASSFSRNESPSEELGHPLHAIKKNTKKTAIHTDTLVRLLIAPTQKKKKKKLTTDICRLFPGHDFILKKSFFSFLSIGSALKSASKVIAETELRLLTYFLYFDVRAVVSCSCQILKFCLFVIFFLLLHLLLLPLGV